MSFDKIGCTPQLATACLALAAAISASMYVRSESNRYNTHSDSISKKTQNVNNFAYTIQTNSPCSESKFKEKNFVLNLKHHIERQ